MCKKSQDLDVKSLFGRQIRQINGFSAAKAEGILNVFPTAISLMRKLASLSEEEAVAMLQSIPVPGQDKGIGQRLATFLFHVYK